MKPKIEMVILVLLALIIGVGCEKSVIEQELDMMCHNGYSKVISFNSEKWYEIDNNGNAIDSGFYEYETVYKTIEFSCPILIEKNESGEYTSTYSTTKFETKDTITNEVISYWRCDASGVMYKWYSYMPNSIELITHVYNKGPIHYDIKSYWDEKNNDTLIRSTITEYDFENNKRVITSRYNGEYLKRMDDYIVVNDSTYPVNSYFYDIANNLKEIIRYTDPNSGEHEYCNE